MKSQMTKDEAKKLGDELSNRLSKKLGGSWRTLIFGKQPYNYCSILEEGSISVVPSQSQSTGEIHYDALVSPTISAYGALSAWDSQKDKHELPEEAVRNALSRANNYVNGLLETLNKNSEHFKE
ncbi:hypothetical protein QQ020_06070 [Fulvivirgaceae bacterium BMA12]|uniref:Uncharacterized protein n=1 Tax=Agaribacillus aureus TaxID=3051825 RepID=A0ABT8L1N9_9BACT|nr:hypothetical protein [Fulvivirgaceae bacterium BMA12]